MSTIAYLHDQVRKLFFEKLHLEVPSVDTDLLEEGILDSLQFVQLLVHVEEEFGIKTSSDDLEIENFRSIRTIAAFIENRK